MASNISHSSDSLIRFDYSYTSTTMINPTNETADNQSSVLIDQLTTTKGLLLSTLEPTILSYASPPMEMSWVEWFSSARVQIPLYATILLLTLVGNSLVIMTLVQNRRMRTITNVFLLNLAVSDILLGVFCMPFTLIGTQLRDFVFGEIMCKLIPYLQGN